MPSWAEWIDRSRVGNWIWRCCCCCCCGMEGDERWLVSPQGTRVFSLSLFILFHNILRSYHFLKNIFNFYFFLVTFNFESRKLWNAPCCWLTSWRGERERTCCCGQLQQLIMGLTFAVAQHSGSYIVKRYGIRRTGGSSDVKIWTTSRFSCSCLQVYYIRLYYYYYSGDIFKGLYKYVAVPSCFSFINIFIYIYVCICNLFKLKKRNVDGITRTWNWRPPETPRQSTTR